MAGKDRLLKPQEFLPEGSSKYLDAHPELDDAQPRVYVKFRPTGVGFSFWALLDTGAHFCLLNQTVAGCLRDHLTDGLGNFVLRTAYGPLEGKLYRHGITLIAEVGRSVDIEATVFVPAGWQGPCFLGYAGVLDHVHFAINPQGNQFSFRVV